MPYKVQCVFLTEEVNDAGEDAERVSDDRAQNYTRHSEEFCQNDRADDITADLKTVAYIVAELVPVAVNHLFKIKDNDGQKRVDRDKSVILKRFFKRISRYAADAEIRVLEHEDQKRGDQSDADADYEPLPVDLIGAAFPHRSDLACENDADARRDEIAEKGDDGGHRRDRVDPGDARYAYEKSGDYAVAEQHKIHYRLGERA